MKHLINNETKELFGFEDNQEELYLKYKEDKRFIDCRLPEKHESWDSNKKCWMLDNEQQAIEQKNQLIQEAKNLIEVTNHFETSSFQAKYWTEEEESEFEQWRHRLFDVVYEGAADIPPAPDFVQQMLDGNIKTPLLQSQLPVEEVKPKKCKTKPKITESEV